MSYVLGIDPGWASCGWSLKGPQGLIVCGSLVPRDHIAGDELLVGAVEQLTTSIELAVWKECECTDQEFRISGDITKVYIERYVAYKGVQSQASEDILMFIGALIHRFEFDGITVVPVRAIDWKPKVCKYLVRSKNFNNPYPSFDKKYSILAAELLCGTKLASNHEADAVCLSYLEEIEKYNKERGHK